MFPAIHDPRSRVLFLHPLLIPAPGAFRPSSLLLLSGVCPWVARLRAHCPTATEAEEGKVSAPGPPPPGYSAAHGSVRPHQEGFEAGTQGLSCRCTVGAEPPLSLVPTHGCPLMRLQVRATAMLYSRLHPGCTVWCHEAAVGTCGQLPVRLPTLVFYSLGGPSATPSACMGCWARAAGALPVKAQAWETPPRHVAHLCQYPPRVLRCPPHLPGEAGPGAPPSSPALIGARGSSSPPG